MQYFKKALFTFLLFTATSTTPLFSNTPLTKQERWDSTAHWVNQQRDGSGYPIDDGIKDTVIVLNLLGFQTRQSCQGHINEGRILSPWIDFAFDNELKDLRERWLVLFQQQHEFIRSILKQHPELSDYNVRTSPAYYEAPCIIALENELNPLEEKIKTEEAKLLLPLRKLLKDFYDQHTCDSDSKLIIDEKWGHDLHSIGDGNRKEKSIEEQKKKVATDQEEMWKFTLFLKHHFFGNVRKNNLSQQEKWNGATNHLEVLEIMPKTCDPAIKDVACSLTLLGLSATRLADGQSGSCGLRCEDREKLKTLYHRLDIAWCDYHNALAEVIRNKIVTTNPDDLPEWKRVVAIREKIAKASKPHFKSLNTILKEFYQKYPCSGDQKIIFTEYGLLSNKGSQKDEKLSEAERSKKMQLYKQEMGRFAQFLKGQFFSDKTKTSDD